MELVYNTLDIRCKPQMNKEAYSSLAREKAACFGIGESSVVILG
jgi:hypothetical protein